MVLVLFGERLFAQFCQVLNGRVDVPVYGFGVFGSRLCHSGGSFEFDSGRRLPGRAYGVDGCTTPCVVAVLVVGLRCQPCQLPGGPLCIVGCVQQALVGGLSTVPAPPAVLDP